ncbi:MAG: T9SS type A sorting domain-containing protein [Williamsia sp.]|nr:T9SS type A sorting domain-containing protein [Williamsia sp.]
MKIFYIFSFILLIALPAWSQERIPAVTEPATAKVLKFYPNPATTQITFTFNADVDRNLSFQIFNFIGKKVYEVQSVTPITNVNLNDFYRGIYIFQLRDKTGKIVDSGKFQKS